MTAALATITVACRLQTKTSAMLRLIRRADVLVVKRSGAIIYEVN